VITLGSHLNAENDFHSGFRNTGHLQELVSLQSDHIAIKELGLVWAVVGMRLSLVVGLYSKWCHGWISVAWLMVSFMVVL